MSGISTIREYMIGLGFEVDKHSFSNAVKSADAFGKEVSRIAEVAAKGFGEVSVAIGAFVAAGVAGLAKFTDGLGNENIQMQILSRQLWTTQQNAYAFSSTLKALGANLQEIYLSPTLMNQYKQLNFLAKGIGLPAGYQQSMQTIQNISLGFKKMKLEGAYALRWIGNYFIKDLAGPLGTVQNGLQKLNNEIVKNLPKWTATIAKWLASFATNAVDTGRAIAGIYKGLQRLAAYIPTWVKVAAAAFAALDVSMSMNPVFLMIEGMTALLLLLDDYYVWSKGGKSEFGGMWSSLTKTLHRFYGMLEQNGAISNFKQTMQLLKEDVDGLGLGLNKAAKAMGQSGTFTQALQFTANLANGLLKTLNGVLQAIHAIEQFESQGKNYGLRASSGQSTTITGGAMTDAQGNPIPRGNITVPGQNSLSSKIATEGSRAFTAIGNFIQKIAGYEGDNYGGRLHRAFGNYTWWHAPQPVHVGSVQSTTHVHIHGNADANKVGAAASQANQAHVNVLMHNMRNLKK